MLMQKRLLPRTQPRGQQVVGPPLASTSRRGACRPFGPQNGFDGRAAAWGGGCPSCTAAGLYSPCALCFAPQRRSLAPCPLPLVPRPRRTRPGSASCRPAVRALEKPVPLPSPPRSQGLRAGGVRPCAQGRSAAEPEAPRPPPGMEEPRAFGPARSRVAITPAAASFALGPCTPSRPVVPGREPPAPSRQEQAQPISIHHRKCPGLFLAFRGRIPRSPGGGRAAGVRSPRWVTSEGVDGTDGSVTALVPTLWASPRVRVRQDVVWGWPWHPGHPDLNAGVPGHPLGHPDRGPGPLQACSTSVMWPPGAMATGSPGLGAFGACLPLAVSQPPSTWAPQRAPDTSQHADGRQSCCSLGRLASLEISPLGKRVSGEGRLFCSDEPGGEPHAAGPAGTGARPPIRGTPSGPGGLGHVLRLLPLLPRSGPRLVAAAGELARGGSTAPLAAAAPPPPPRVDSGSLAGLWVYAGVCVFPPALFGVSSTHLVSEAPGGRACPVGSPVAGE